MELITSSAGVKEAMTLGPSAGSRVTYNPHPPFAVDRPRPQSGKRSLSSFQHFLKLLEILVSQESVYFSHSPWQMLRLKSVLFKRYSEKLHGYGFLIA